MRRSPGRPEAFITQNLSVTIGGSYNDTKIGEGNLAIAACGSGCSVLDPAGRLRGTVSINGNVWPQPPKSVANMTIKFTLPMSRLGWAICVAHRHNAGSSIM